MNRASRKIAIKWVNEQSSLIMSDSFFQSNEIDEGLIKEISKTHYIWPWNPKSPMRGAMIVNKNHPSLMAITEGDNGEVVAMFKQGDSMIPLGCTTQFECLLS